MGDRTYATITLSGKLNREHAEQLIDELKGQGCQPDAGYAVGDEITEADLVGRFFDEQCNYATMDGVEGFCHDHGVSYLLTWSSGGEYSAGYKLYNAVVDQEFEVAGDDEPALGLSELTQFAKEGKTLQDVVAYLQAISDFARHYPPLELVQ